MAPVAEQTAFEKLLRPLGSEMSLEVMKGIAGMTVDADTQARYEYLARGATENTLSENEREELESLVRANSVLGLLKAEAHLRLHRE